MNISTLPDAFAKTEGEFFRLKGQLSANHITEEQFRAAIKKLLVKHGGRYWMLGVRSGKWYVHDGKVWVLAQPPSAVDRAKMRAPFRIRLSSGSTLELVEGTRLSAPAFGLGGGDAVAEVTVNPDDPSVLGLKNLTGRAWTATTPGGEPRTVEPGRSIRLAIGTTIDFGVVRGDIGTQAH